MSTGRSTSETDDEAGKKPAETEVATTGTAVEARELHDEKARQARELREGRQLVDNPDGSKSFKFTDGREMVISDKGATLVLPGQPPKVFPITKFNIENDTISYQLGHLTFSESPNRRTVFNNKTDTLSVYDAQDSLLTQEGRPGSRDTGAKTFQSVFHSTDATLSGAATERPGALPTPGIDTLPPDVQGSTKIALKDLAEGKAVPCTNLEIAFNKAAQVGRLADFVNATNKELRQSGLPYKISAGPDGKTFELRTSNGQVIRDFGPFDAGAPTAPAPARPETESDPKKLYAQKELLEADAKRGVEGAIKKLQAVESRLNVLEIERFGSPDSIKKLLTKALEGNDSARAVLTSLLVSGAQAEEWRKAVRSTDGTTSEVPDLSKLSDQQRRAIKLAAVRALDELSEKKGGLSSSESAALGLALADAAKDAAKNKESQKLVDTIKELFDKTLTKATAKDSPEEADFARRTEKILNGLYAAIRAPNEKSPGLSALLAIYGKAAESQNNKYIHDHTDRGAIRVGDVGRSFANQVADCESLARSGDRKAMEMLAMFVGGAGKFNSQVNEEVFDERKGTRAPGDALVKRSSAELIEIAKTNPAHRQTLLHLLSGDLLTKGTAPNKPRQIETLGRIAALDPSSTPETVLQALRTALEKPELKDSAAVAMLCCGAKLTPVDMSTLSKNMSPNLVSRLGDAAATLPLTRATELSNALSLRAFDAKVPAEDRALAIKAIAAVISKHEMFDGIAALQQFGGKAGREALEAQLKEDKYSYPTDKAVKDAADKIQAAAAEALLSIAEQSTGERVKAEAFRAFSTREWDAHKKSFHHQDYKHRLEDLMSKNPDNIAIQSGVPKIVLDLNRDKVDPVRSSPDATTVEITRLAAAFADRGATTSDEGLKSLTRAAVDAHGAEEVRKVLDRIALFNAVSPEMRKALSGSDADMKAGEHLDLSGRKLPPEVFNKLPEQLRSALQGFLDKATGIWTGKAGAELTAAQFNALAPELRKALTATDKPIAADLVLGLLANRTIENPHSPAHTLFGKPPLEERVAADRKSANEKVKSLETELAELVRMKETGLRDLHKHAEQGAGFLEKMKADPYCRSIVINAILGPVAGTATSLAAENSGVKWDAAMEKFKANQEKYLDKIAVCLEPLIERQYARIQEAQTGLLSIDLALANQQYVRLASRGMTRQADEYAIQTYAKHGQATLALAPDIAKTFMPQGEGINNGTLRRLHASGDSQFPLLVINPFTGSDKRTTDTSPSKGFERGLALLAAIKPAEGRSDYTKAEKGSFYADAPILRREAFAGIDQAPELAKLNALAQKLNEQLSALNTEVGIMKSGGDRFKALIDDANRRAKIVKEALEGLSPLELGRLREMHSTIEKSLKDDSIKDPEAKKELQKRLASLTQGLTLFDKDFDVEKHHPEKFAKLKALQREYDMVKGSWALADTPPLNEKDPRYLALLDAKYDIGSARHRYWLLRRPELEEQLRELRGELYQRKNIEKVVHFLEKPEAKDESTFQTWAKRDGVELLISTGFAIAATAAVVASCGTATPGVLALAAAGGIGAMAGREIAKGILLAQGVSSHGSTAYEWWNSGTVEDKDGSERKVGLLTDVLPEYGTELVVGTGVGIAGSIVGSAIGQGLRSMGRSALKVFLTENLPALSKLTGNIEAINKVAAASGWFGRFGAAAMREGVTNLALTPASMIAEHGISAAVRHMKLAVDDSNMLTSFLATVAVSIPFGMMHPTVHPRKGVFKPGEPHLSLGYSGTKAEMNNYINSAHERGSMIKFHPGGGFTEVTKEGLVVRWTRDTAATTPVKGAAETGRPGTTTAHEPHAVPGGGKGGVPGSEHPVTRPSGAGGPGVEVLPPGTHKPGEVARALVEVDPLLRRTPEEVAKMHAEMNKLMQPVKDAYGKVIELERTFKEREMALSEKLNKCPETPKGEADAAHLSKQIREERITYERERKALQASAEQLRTSIAVSDEYRKLHIASSLAEGKFPSGEHRVKLPDGDAVTLLVGMETVEEGGKLVRKSVGCSVPQEHVDEILKALKARGIRPEQVTIRTEHASTIEGALRPHGRSYEIMINTAHEQVRMTYNHETGHLYDLEHFRNAAPEAVRGEVHKAYMEGLKGDLAASAAKHLGETPSAAFAESFLKGLATSDAVYNHEIKTPKDYQRYLACKSEVFAEMFKLHQENRRIVAEGGKPLSYAELVDRFTSPHNQQRGDVMKHFEKMYNVLSEKVFSTIPDGGKKLPRGAFIGPASDGVLPSKAAPSDTVTGAPKRNMPTDYSTIGKQIGEVKDALDSHVSGKRLEPAQRDVFISALGDALQHADPQTLKTIGDRLGQLATAADFPQRLAHLTDVLRDPRLARLGPPIETLLDPKMPRQNLESLSEFMRSDAFKHAFNSGDAHAMQKFRESLSKLSHSPELLQRLEIAKRLEPLFRETHNYRLDFVLDANISVAKLQDFTTVIHGMNKGDMVFAYPEVTQALRNAPPEAARHLIENLPQMVKSSTSAEDAVERLTALRVVAESCQDLNGLTQLPSVLAKRNAHLSDAAYRPFVDHCIYAGVERVLVDSAPQSLKKSLSAQLPELARISKSKPEELISSVRKMRDTLQDVNDALYADYRVLGTTLKEIIQKRPELAKSEPFAKMLDETLGNGIMRDARLLEINSANLLVKMAKDIQTLTLPADDKLKTALEKRIDDLLNSHPELSTPRRQALEALQSSFKLSDKLRKRIQDYTPAPARGTEVVGTDILENFKQSQPRSAVSLDEFMKKLSKNQFSNPHDVTNVFPQTDHLGERLYVFDIGGNDYRLVAKLDFATKQLIVSQIGTHAEYDRWVLKPKKK